MPLGYPDFYRRVRIKAVDTRVYAATTYLTPGGTLELWDWKGHDLEVETLEISLSDDDEMVVLIEAYKEDGTLQPPSKIPYTTPTEGGVVDLTPSAIRSYKSALFDLLVDDDVNKHFKIGLKRPIRFPHGVRLSFKNKSTTTVFYMAWLAVVARFSAE